MSPSRESKKLKNVDKVGEEQEQGNQVSLTIDSNGEQYPTNLDMPQQTAGAEDSEESHGSKGHPNTDHHIVTIPFEQANYEDSHPNSIHDTRSVQFRPDGSGGDDNNNNNEKEELPNYDKVKNDVPPRL